ncbi:hypothetical protein BSK71_17030 [Pectobacterium actinidiae]|uniref:Uncharacterized protein n=1 Tax=Pectobacterium actinidiae TaxID=1507808 RepID=A0A1V2R0G8_9GAMM|nr:hypothetical protein BSK69_19605 [Pectobacterium actinidiae]ONK02877.1 hypothetical protein BSK71_17030 [Pectobacterium actinidiae]
MLLAFLSRFNHGFPSEAARTFTCRWIIVDGTSVYQSPAFLQPAELSLFFRLAPGLVMRYSRCILLLFVVIAQSLILSLDERFYRDNDCYVICIACFFFIYRYLPSVYEC